MAWCRAKMSVSKPMATHSKPSNGVYIQECLGQFQWAKVHPASGKPEIRRECPLCGCRQFWHDKGKTWHSADPNPQPGSHDKYLHHTVNWGP